MKSGLVRGPQPFGAWTNMVLLSTGWRTNWKICNSIQKGEQTVRAETPHLQDRRMKIMASSWPNAVIMAAWKTPASGGNMAL